MSGWEIWFFDFIVIYECKVFLLVKYVFWVIKWVKNLFCIKVKWVFFIFLKGEGFMSYIVVVVYIGEKVLKEVVKLLGKYY